jgi:mRNA interferase YafQ
VRLLTTRRFERDLKKAGKRGRDTSKLERAVKLLLEDRPLPPSMRPHTLSGDWKGFYECHLEPDWLLIWRRTDNALILVRTGSHSDLFK